MAATDGEHAIQFPDTLAGTEGEQGVQDRKTPIGCVGCCCLLLKLLAGIVAIGSIIMLMVQALHDAKVDVDPTPKYSAAIAGLHGLDAAASAVAGTALFNLTIHIKNPSQVNEACVAHDSMAVVSYGGALVAAGAVPPFCAGKTAEREVVVPVFGLGADVPGALRTREAVVVDVAIRMPPCGKYERLLACSVKVGEGLSLCTGTASSERRCP